MWYFSSNKDHKPGLKHEMTMKSTFSHSLPPSLPSLLISSSSYIETWYHQVIFDLITSQVLLLMLVMIKPIGIIIIIIIEIIMYCMQWVFLFVLCRGTGPHIVASDGGGEGRCEGPPPQRAAGPSLRLARHREAEPRLLLERWPPFHQYSRFPLCL